MSTKDRRRPVGSTHAEPTYDNGDLSAAERKASLGWAQEKEYETPSIRGVRETAYGMVCLIADGNEYRGLIVVDGLKVVTGINGPEAAFLFRELPKEPPPWA